MHIAGRVRKCEYTMPSVLDPKHGTCTYSRQSIGRLVGVNGLQVIRDGIPQPVRFLAHWSYLLCCTCCIVTQFFCQLDAFWPVFVNTGQISCG